MARPKVILMMSQSNSMGVAPMASLPVGYSSNYSNIKVWNGSSGFLNMNSATNTNQWPNTNNCFGIEYKLGTLLAAYYPSETIYFIKPSWGSHGLQNGAGSAGTYDPTIRGNVSGKYDTGISAFNEGLNSLFSSVKNNFDIIAFVFIGGEADAKTPYDTTYQAALTNYVSKIRAAVNKPLLPFIACRLSTSINSTTCPKFAEVNTATDNVAAAVSRVHAVNTNSCTLQGDGVHYDADGFETLGQAVYNVLSTNGYLI